MAAYSYAASSMCTLGTAAERLSAQIAFMAPHLPARPTVLEIGCATGELAAAIRSKVPTGSYEAIELSPAGDKARPHLTKLHRQPLLKALEEGAIAEDSFDLVIISHVLEHLADPHAECAGMRRALRSEGLLFIEVPNGSGNRILPFDDNVSHIHFFSANSLIRLLSAHEFQCIALATDAKLDARYADSLRVAARPFALPRRSPKLLSAHPKLRDLGQVIVWGAGSLVTELLANFMDPAQILFFVDRDPSKQGKVLLGRPVHAPDAVRDHPDRPILINSVDYGPSILAELTARYPDRTGPLVQISELLGEMLPTSIAPRL